MKSAINNVTDFLEQKFESCIRAKHLLPQLDGDFRNFPETLNPKLANVLTNQGINSLYSHQEEAFQSITENKDTVLASKTAGGKTLAFLLPILNEYLNSDAPFGVMMLYPTKALSRDQEGTLGSLLKSAGASLRLGTFDGDTPREERRNIQRSADFVITNPDMLHAGILPNHNRNWKNFLSKLRYIVIDEVHVYRGAFGSHVSNVFRRLLRVCEMHGASPTFICCSATIGNPGEHVQALFRRPFHVISKDGAPRPPRDLYLVNPPLVQSHGAALYRKGPGSISIPLIRQATEQGVRTICFCRARQEVERLYRAVIDRHPGLRNKIQPYRGGLLPNERRQLERDLFQGRITTIITTNALELGIDIGDLDLCILSGHPGTLAAFHQQAGRVGRKGSKAVVVFIAKDAPVDQYMVHHPEFITAAPVEQAWLNADNPYIILQHIPCAAHEHPLRPEEPRFQNLAYSTAVEILAGEQTLVPYRDCFRYNLPDYPAKGVNLRGMTDYNVDIYCGSEVIGEIDPIGARGTLYKDAIYQHLGRRFMSMDLDLKKKLCRVEPVNVDYYTEAVWENRLEMTAEEEEKEWNDARLKFGYIHVNKQPKLYKKIRERTYENIGYGPITLPPFEYDTTGFSMLTPKNWRLEIEKLNKNFLDAAMFGLSYLLRRAAPSLCMADMNDIETDVSLHEEERLRWKSTLFLYDAHHGGIGYAEKIYEKILDALSLCRRIIDECECKSGCPSCIPPLPPGINNEKLEEILTESNAAVACTRSLLTMLIEGNMEIPKIESFEQPVDKAVEPPEPDHKQIKLRNRLSRAAGILRKHREKLH